MADGLFFTVDHRHTLTIYVWLSNGQIRFDDDDFTDLSDEEYTAAKRRAVQLRSADTGRLRASSHRFYHREAYYVQVRYWFLFFSLK